MIPSVPTGRRRKQSLLLGTDLFVGVLHGTLEKNKTCKISGNRRANILISPFDQGHLLNIIFGSYIYEGLTVTSLHSILNSFSIGQNFSGQTTMGQTSYLDWTDLY